MSNTVWRLLKPGSESLQSQEGRAFSSLSELVEAMKSEKTLPTWIVLSPEALIAHSSTEPIRYKEICFDPDRLEVEIFSEETRCTLSFKEGQLLKKLLSAAGTCVSRSELYTLLWGTVKVSARTLDSHVSRLRAKLEGAQIEILTVYGDGYLLR